MAISQAQIDEVLSKSDIVEVIGKFINVQKKGSSYVAVCPFHDDSSPSLSISPEKKIFKCFPCGIGGSVFTFLQEFKQIKFFSAVKEIADMYDIMIDGYISKVEPSKFNLSQQKLIEINTQACIYFQVLLQGKSGREARKYLKERFITEQEVEKFSIGFAPRGYDLFLYLIDYGFSKEEIYKSGLIDQKGVKNSVFFYNRLIFPIRDEDSHIIGFSGRIIDNSESAKYKNSSENDIFKKSQLAYNLDNAKKTARLREHIIVLEGFMDVISLEKIGIDNSIAIMGTNLSNYHLKLLSKVSKKIKLFLDGDDAGIKASIKSAKFLMDNNFEVTIIDNKTNKDPDELVNEGNENLLKEMILNSKHPVDFVFGYYEKKLDLKDLNSVNFFIENIVDILIHEKSEIKVASSISRIADLLTIDKEVIKEQLLKVKPKNKIIIKELNETKEPQYYEVPDNSFIMDNYEQEIETVSVISIKKKPEKQEENYAFRFKRAETNLIYHLLKGDTFVKQISKMTQNLIEVVNRRIANFVVDKYDSKEYEGDNFEKIKKLITPLGDSYIEKISEIQNTPREFVPPAATESLFEDIDDTLNSYKRLIEIRDLQLQLDSLQEERKLLLNQKELAESGKIEFNSNLDLEIEGNYQLQISLAKLLEQLRTTNNKIIRKKGNHTWE